MVSLPVIITIIVALISSATLIYYLLEQPQQPTQTPSTISSSIERTNLSTGKVGMAVQYPQLTNEKLISLLKEGGIQVFHSGWIAWEDVEKTSGSYDFSSVDPLFKIINDSQFDFEIAIDIGPLIALSYDRPSLPSYIQFKGWNDPYLKERYLAFLGAFSDRYGGKINYLLIHTEGAPTYFTEYHPEQLNDYCNLIAETMRYVKQKTPHIKVGTSGNEFLDTKIAQCVSKEADFIGLALTPDEKHQFKEPQDVERIIDNLAQISPKKLVLEIGYYTSDKLGSSETKQVEFIKFLFQSLKKHKDKIEYIAYFELTDQNRKTYGDALRSLFPPGTDETFMQNLIELTTTTGLLKENGSPKPGWGEFKNQVKAYYVNVAPTVVS